MRYHGFGTVFVAIVAFHLSLAGATHADALKFDVVPLGPVQSTLDSGDSINGYGTVAFTVSTNVSLWQNGVTTPIPNLSSGNAAVAINDAGDLAGTDQQRAFIYKDGTKTGLGTFSGGFTAAGGISDDDVVVGDSYDASANAYRAFAWQDGTLGRLPAPGGGYSQGVESCADCGSAPAAQSLVPTTIRVPIKPSLSSGTTVWPQP